MKNRINKVINENSKTVSLQNYDITGFYYENNDYQFRKYLNIKFKDSDIDIPDLMVIMMNPGSSSPINGTNDSRVETQAKPDPTQTQIIRVMEHTGFKYARILNLSDLREPSSIKFYNKIKPMNLKGIDHSVFSRSRKEDFEKLYVKGVPVIYAWGVNRKLLELANTALIQTKSAYSYGWRKPKFDFAFYHPLPRSSKKQLEWFDIVKEQFRK